LIYPDECEEIFHENGLINKNDEDKELDNYLFGL
jgi:hypothetical protein